MQNIAARCSYLIKAEDDAFKPHLRKRKTRGGREGRGGQGHTQEKGRGDRGTAAGGGGTRHAYATDMCCNHASKTVLFTSTRGTESTAQQGGAATWGANLILLHEPNADAGLVIEKAEDEVDGLHHALCTLGHFL